MATGNDIPDPAKMSAAAQENLRKTMDNLAEHIDALTKPTMALALAAEKRAQEGAEAVEPSALLEKYVSWAKAPSGLHVPGELNEDRSDAGAPRGRAPRRQMSESEREDIVGAGSKIAGEDITIPQFGDWRIDSLLKLSAQVAAKGWSGNKGALGRYASDAAKAEEAGETLTPEQWMGESGFGQTLGGLSNRLTQGAHFAAMGSLLHKKVIGPAADIVFGATNQGASLGFSPQAGGGAFEQSHILGIPNPIAQFLSPAGKQGLGMASNAFQASVLGTGIGFGEAAGLREALGAQGWHNTRGGGFLNLTEGGPNETLARALEPMMKQGVKNPEVLAEFSDAVRLGTTSIQELTESLGGQTGLSETAQVLNKTVEATAVALQEFAAKSVEGGSTMAHGFRTGREVAAMTGMNPNIVEGINSSNFGRVQALEKGILPWQIAGMSGAAKSANALETVEKVMSFVPKNLKPITRKNVNGEEETVESVREQEMGWLHQLDPNITNEQAEHLLKLKGKLPYITAGLHQAGDLATAAYNKEHGNIQHGTWFPQVAGMQSRWQSQHAHTMDLKAKLKQDPENYELEEQLEKAEEAEHGTAGKLHDLASKSKKQGALKPAQEAELNRALGGEKGLFETAYKAGVSNKEIERIHGMDVKDQAKELHKALEKIAQVNIEKKQEENAKIELAGPAKFLFKLKFPKVSKFLEQNAGGEQTSNSAASPNSATSPASQQALERGAEKAAREE